MANTSTHTSDANASGLSTERAQALLASNGPNELPSDGPRSLALIAREVLTEPMFLLLLAAAAIYIVLGEGREAIALSTSLLAVIAITVLQARRTEHALAKLRDLSAAQALVLRDGMQVRVNSRDIVVGDVLLLSEGDRVPADATLLTATALSVDESILTGESLPVDKTVTDRSDVASNVVDALGQVFSGSLVVRGFGTARVIATGVRSEIGKIGGALNALSPEATPLFREVHRIVRWVASAGILLCIAIAMIYALSRHNWLSGVLAGITVAMGVLPEEFPVVLTIFLAMGAWRISRHGVLTRRMPAIETIGAATVLAVDKTGTLTENRMRVAVIDSITTRIDLRHEPVALGEQWDEQCRQVLAIALAASERDAFDPMEHAIHNAATRFVDDATKQLAQQQLIREYDLTPELLAVTHVWRHDNESMSKVAVKGAPETVFELCRLDAEQRAALLARVAAYARDGLRVLAIASGTHADTALPDSPREFNLQFLGLLCLADPLRDNIPAMLAECRQAGIRVLMITGDHAGTALAIAIQAGIDTAAGVLTGAEMVALTPEALRDRIRTVNVYARIAPEQKLLLVQTLRSNGEIVVMTGDGVNDAPALKAAHVGVAMGKRGTEVAREAASLVLMNDDFAALVSAVRLGRRIYDNIRHAMSYIIAIHIPIAGLGLLPVLLGWPLLLYPLHVMFLELVIDPACSFVFEADAAADDVMRRPPRSPTEGLFSKRVIYRSVTRGSIALLFVVLVYAGSIAFLSENQARALGFMALVSSSVLLIYVSRANGDAQTTRIARPNKLFWWISGVTASALVAIIYVPTIARLFQIDTQPFQVVATVPILGVLVFSLTTILLRKHYRSAFLSQEWRLRAITYFAADETTPNVVDDLQNCALSWKTR